MSQQRRPRDRSTIARRRRDLEGVVRRHFLDFLDLCRGEIDDLRAKDDVTADIKRVAALLHDQKDASPSPSSSSSQRNS